MVSRREFIHTAAALTAASVSATALGQDSNMASTESPGMESSESPEHADARIDTHHHFLPPDFIEAVKRAGKDSVAGAALPVWSPEQSIAQMNANGIATAVVSIGSPGVHFGDDGQARELAAYCNEYARDLKQQFPGRFGYFAQLPMPLVEASLTEARRALDELGANGVGLLGSTNGMYLGNPAFEPLMQLLNERGTTVFVHPDIHASTEHVDLAIPGFMIEFLVDTSRAIANLALTGTFERYPDIQWIFAHAGGFVPYIAWRLSLADFVPDLRKNMPKGMLTYLQRLYFDTALSTSPYAMASLTELVDASHILFASDFPYAPAMISGKQIKDLEALSCFTPEDRGRINRKNALGLMPSLAGAVSS